MEVKSPLIQEDQSVSSQLVEACHPRMKSQRKNLRMFATLEKELVLKEAMKLKFKQQFEKCK